MAVLYLLYPCFIYGLAAATASAASARRRVGVNSGSSVVMKSMQKKTVKLSPQKTSLSDKRRHAALVSWEKRRAKSEQHALSKRKAIIVDRHVNPRKDKCKSPPTKRQKIYAKVSSERKRNQQSARDTKRKTDAIRSRRNAAKLGCERRRNQFASVPMSNIKKNSKKITLSISRSAVRSRTASKPPPQRGSKRSRRLAGESAGSHKEGTKKMNNLIAYLRVTRSWMEFRVSTRHGSGIATYGYFPSSIASFIRSGTISQRTVLDHGKLGVHYALDWDGCGGLKEMIDTFGEVY